MKILFDANVPAPLARWLRGHDVVLAVEVGWHRLINGKLLDAAQQGGFDVLITCDQNLTYQQNLADRKVSVVVLSTNRWPAIRPVAARIATLAEFVQRGQVLRIDVADLAIAKAPL